MFTGSGVLEANNSGPSSVHHILNQRSLDFLWRRQAVSMEHTANDRDRHGVSAPTRVVPSQVWSAWVS
ncbi:hypothetical protein CapIbe_008684 [Capra ibex]